jgi:hypothetical protein
MSIPPRASWDETKQNQKKNIKTECEMRIGWKGSYCFVLLYFFVYIFFEF